MVEENAGYALKYLTFLAETNAAVLSAVLLRATAKLGGVTDLKDSNVTSPLAISLHWTASRTSRSRPS
jgi:hypothetical protein